MLLMIHVITAPPFKISIIHSIIHTHHTYFNYPLWCSSTSSVIGSLLTGQSGSPFVEREDVSDDFGLLSGFGVSGPFTFRLQKIKKGGKNKHFLCKSHYKMENPHNL